MGTAAADRVRDRSTSDALLEAYKLPSMDMPPVSRPIGMVHLRRSSRAENGTDDHAQRHSLGAGMSAEKVQSGVDMLQSSNQPLSPEDLATIVSECAAEQFGAQVKSQIDCVCLPLHLIK